MPIWIIVIFMLVLGIGMLIFPAEMWDKAKDHRDKRNALLFLFLCVLMEASLGLWISTSNKNMEVESVRYFDIIEYEDKNDGTKKQLAKFDSTEDNLTAQYGQWYDPEVYVIQVKTYKTHSYGIAWYSWSAEDKYKVIGRIVKRSEVEIDKEEDIIESNSNLKGKTNE